MSRLTETSFLEFYAGISPLLTRWDSLDGETRQSLLDHAARASIKEQEFLRLVSSSTDAPVLALWRAAPVAGSQALGRIAGREAVRTPVAEQERALWSNFQTAPLLDRMRVLERARTFYFRHRNVGGRAVLSWVEEMGRLLLEDIVSNNRYWELVRRREDGFDSLNIPLELKLPQLLRFPSGAERPAVLLSPQGGPRNLGHWAYARVESIGLIQDVVCESCVAYLEGRLEQGERRPPVQIAFDRRDRDFYLFHGYHRAFAARARGADYILGRLDFFSSRQFRRFSLDSIRGISHEEHRDLIEMHGGSDRPKDETSEAVDPFEGRFF